MSNTAWFLSSCAVWKMSREAIGEQAASRYGSHCWSRCRCPARRDRANQHGKSGSRQTNSETQCRLVFFIFIASCCVGLSTGWSFPLASVRPRWSPCLTRISQCSHLRPMRNTPLGRKHPRPSSGELFAQMNFDSDEDRRKGVIVLATVPIAWGSYEPAVRLVYQIQPDIPPFVFSLFYYLMAATLLTYLGSKSSSLERDERPLRAGIELGTYLFLGNGFQVLGLKTVQADRAAFLLQLTTVFVPILQSLIARDVRTVPSTTWIACLVALLGVAIISLDIADTNGAFQDILQQLTSLGSLSLSHGDILVVCAALLYTFHCVRLETFARNVSAIQLASSKAIVESSWSLATIALSILATQDTLTVFSDNAVVHAFQLSGENVLSYFDTISTSTTSALNWTQLFLATAWVGLITVGYTIYAQSFGQARVPAATANLIYTIQPICTAIFAWFLLGEVAEPNVYVGGLIIGVAVLLVLSGTDIQGNKNEN